MAAKAWWVLVPMVVSSVAIAAGKPNNAGQERKDAQKIQAAQKDVTAAKQDIQQAQKAMQAAEHALDQAQARVKTATSNVQVARKAAEEKNSANSQLQQAQAAHDSARTAYDSATAPILAGLRAKPEHKAAMEKAAAAKARMQTIRDDAGLSADQRSQQLAEASKEMLAVNQLEQAAITAAPAVLAAKERLAAAQARVGQLHTEQQEKIVNDSGVKSAAAELASARDAVNKAQAQVASYRSKLAKEQGDLAKEQADLNRAQAQDRANDKKPQPKNNNNKKKK